MRYWLDTEFIEEPGTVDLISIGIVAEDGREFYAESSEVNWSRANAWVREHVRPHLDGPSSEADMTRAMIRQRVLEFVGTDARPRFWGYYCDYDWVVFCWLFGRMIDLPEGWPKFCRDIKQAALALGDPQLPKQDTVEHHALADARWNRVAWDFLRDIELEYRRGEVERHPAKATG